MGNRAKLDLVWTVALVTLAGIVALSGFGWHQLHSSRRSSVSGPRWRTLLELAPPEVPAEENAALLLAPLLELHDQDRSLLANASQWKPAAPLDAAVGEEPGAVVEQVASDFLEGRSPTNNEREVLRAFLGDAEPELEVIARATRLDRWRFDLPLHRDPPVFRRDGRPFLLIPAARFLGALALDQLDRGEPGEAVVTICTGLRLARACANDATLLANVAYSVTTMTVLNALEHALARMPAGVDLSALEQELDAFDPRTSLLRALEGELAYSHYMLQQLRGSKAGAGTVHAMVSSSNLARLEARFPLTFGLRLERLNEYWRRVLASVGQPYFRARAELDEFERWLDDPPWYSLLAQLTDLRATAWVRSCARHEARKALAQLALVGQREGFAAMAAAAATTVDPLSGSPVRCARDDDGSWVLSCSAPEPGAPPVTWRVVAPQ